MWNPTIRDEDLRFLIILQLSLELTDGAIAYNIADFILELGDEAIKEAAALVWPIHSITSFTTSYPPGSAIEETPMDVTFVESLFDEDPHG